MMSATYYPSEGRKHAGGYEQGGIPVAARLAVVILTYNRAPELLRTVAHTVALPERPEVLVVDNGSTDGSLAQLRRRFPQVRLLPLEANLGAAGRNLGARAVNRDYLAFSDDDTRWDPGSLARAVAILDAYPSLAVLSARVLVGPERRDDDACLAMRASPLPSEGLPGPALIGFMAGAAVFRRQAFLEAGGYEPKLFLGGEEALLALDLAARGWAIVYAESLVVHHYPSPRRDVGARRRLLARNALWVAWLRRPLCSALRQTLSVLRGGLRDPLVRRGALEALRGLPWALRHRRVIPAPLELSCRQVERWLRETATAGPQGRGRGRPSSLR
jgi:GT2 family glycosyltransferase